MKPAATLIWLLLLVSQASWSQARSESLQELVKQWLNLEQQNDQLQIGWQQNKLVLDQRLQLLQAEKRSLQQQLREHSGLQNKVQQHRGELVEQQNVLEKNQQQMTATLQQLAISTAGTQPRLPEPLAAHWKSQLERLEQIPGGASNSQRLDGYLGMLKSLDEFQQKVTQHQTLMAIDGKQILVDQVYLGLAQGWYLSRDGQHSGIGRADTGHWQWQADRSVAPMLQDVLAALKEPAKARLLPLKVILNEAPER